MGIFDSLRKKKEAPEGTQKEKRLLPRWDISAPAKIRYAGEESYLACEVKNLNLKGFAVIIGQPLPDQCAQTTLYFNENFFFTVDVERVWHNESNGRHIYGFKFTRIRDTDKEKIFKMIQQDFPHCLKVNL